MPLGLNRDAKVLAVRDNSLTSRLDRSDNVVSCRTYGVHVHRKEDGAAWALRPAASRKHCVDAASGLDASLCCCAQPLCKRA
eukprot:3971858-Heterocapsa_arctica.AAC.1